MESSFLSLDSGISGDFYWFFSFPIFHDFSTKKKKNKRISLCGNTK